MTIAPPHADPESLDQRLTDINRRIGARLRTQRRSLRMSQETLGEALGVSFQQVQKYENGANRLSAASLIHLASIGIDPASVLLDPQQAAPSGDPAAAANVAWLSSRIAVECARLFGPLAEADQEDLLAILQAGARRYRAPMAEAAE